MCVRARVCVCNLREVLSSGNLKSCELLPFTPFVINDILNGSPWAPVLALDGPAVSRRNELVGLSRAHDLKYFTVSL